MKKTIINYQKKNNWYKMLFLTCLLIGLLMTVQAQKSPQKGQWMLGQSFNINSEKSDSTTIHSEIRSLNIKLQSNISYFIHKRIAIGLLFNYEYTKRTVGTTSPDIWKNAELGPMLRYYPMGGLFLEAATKWNTEFVTFYTENNHTNMQHHVGIGYSYLLSPKVALEPKFYYQFYSNEDIYNTQYKTNFIIGVQIFL